MAARAESERAIAQVGEAASGGSPARKSVKFKEEQDVKGRNGLEGEDADMGGHVKGETASSTHSKIDCNKPEIISDIFGANKLSGNQITDNLPAKHGAASAAGKSRSAKKLSNPYGPLAPAELGAAEDSSAAHGAPSVGAGAEAQAAQFLALNEAAGPSCEPPSTANESVARLQFILEWAKTSAGRKECVHDTLLHNAGLRGLYAAFNAEWREEEAGQALDEFSAALSAAHAEPATQAALQTRGQALARESAAQSQGKRLRGSAAAGAPQPEMQAPRCGAGDSAAGDQAARKPPRPRAAVEGPHTPMPEKQRPPPPQQQQQQRQQQQQQQWTTAGRRKGDTHGGQARPPAPRTKGSGPKPTPYLSVAGEQGRHNRMQWRAPGGGWLVLPRFGRQPAPEEGWDEWRLRMSAHGRWWMQEGVSGWLGSSHRGPGVRRGAQAARGAGDTAGSAAPGGGGAGKWGAPARGSYVAAAAAGAQAGGAVNDSAGAAGRGPPSSNARGDGGAVAGAGNAVPRAQEVTRADLESLKAELVGEVHKMLSVFFVRGANQQEADSEAVARLMAA